ncbi:unnamed protein product, partial [Prorocentrum cordatum]
PAARCWRRPSPPRGRGARDARACAPPAALPARARAASRGRGGRGDRSGGRPPPGAGLAVRTRPRDALEGLAQGVKLGALALACAPLALAGAAGSGLVELRRRRPLRALLVLGGGCAVGALAAGVGLLLAVVQLGRGLLGTPRAVRARADQQSWDASRGAWVDLDLRALEREVAVPDEPEFEAASSVAETEFYDVLRVATSASTSDIKKAYYREARLCHPDINPGDEGATARFQTLSEAYKVLGDSELRKQYDAGGKSAVDSKGLLSQIDPAVFFSLLFGFDSFEPWVGEIDLAMRMEQLAKSGGRRPGPPRGGRDLLEAWQKQMLDSRGLARRQLRREVGCALHLRTKLDSWTAEGAGAWEARLRSEAAALARGSRRGPELLATLGEAYGAAGARDASAALGVAAAAARAARALRRRCSTAREVASGLRAARRGLRAAARSRRSGAPPPQSAQAAADEALPLMVSLAWRAVVVDVGRTAASAARMVLQDKSVAPQARQHRAVALGRLARVFAAEAAEAGSAPRAGPDEREPGAVQASIREALAGSVSGGDRATTGAADRGSRGQRAPASKNRAF